MDERIIDVECNEDTTRNCAIKLNSISCDGYKRGRGIGVFSHFHDDHIAAISDCVASYDALLTHPITFEGINALKPGMKYREQWVTQDYDSAYKFVNGTIRLLKANHIPGSSQVYVESDDKTMLYSGDFSFPDIQIRQADYLVIDSTHGDPSMDGSTDRKSVKNRMFEHVVENVNLHNHVVIQASSGTLQEIIRHFEVGYGKKMNDDITFVMDKKQENVLRKIYKDEADQFRHMIEYDSPDFWNTIRNNKKCVIFLPGLLLDDEVYNFHKIMVDRFRFQKNESPITPFDGGCRFNLAAHTSIKGIYDYIEHVNPKYVVTDNSRSQYAKNLARLIEQKFTHIKTEYRPP